MILRNVVVCRLSDVNKSLGSGDEEGVLNPVPGGLLTLDWTDDWSSLLDWYKGYLEWLGLL